MRETTIKTQQTISPISAGIAGVVLGAIGTAVALILTDEEKKKQVVEHVTKLRDDINSSMNQWVSQARDMQQKGAMKAEQTNDEVIDTTDELLDAADKELDDMKEKRSN